MLCLKVIQIMIRNMNLIILLNLDAKYYYIIGVSII